MVTNFTHLQPYGDLFDKIIFAEDMIVDGTCKEHFVQAISAIRGALDIMMKRFTGHMGLNDQMILSLVPSSDSRVNLFSRIEALSRSGKITKQSANNLHEIRKHGNDAVHGGESIGAMSKDNAYRLAEQMYRLFYEESHRFAAVCSSPAAAQGAGQPAYRQGYAESAQTGGGSFGFAVLGFLFPPLGFILAILLCQSRPADARAAGKGAWTSIAIAVMLALLYIYVSSS